MSNIAFNGSYSEWLNLKLPNSPGSHGYIYAFFFSNGFAKVGGSSKPHARLQQLLETFERSGHTEAVTHVVLTPLLVDYIQQEKALHKSLPQASRRFEYFQIGHSEFCAILESRQLKRFYTDDELERQRASGARSEAMMEALIEPLKAGKEYQRQLDEFGFSPKASASLRLIAMAVRLGVGHEAIEMLEMSSSLIDEMADSEQKEDVAAIYCAVCFALENGLTEHANNLPA